MRVRQSGNVTGIFISYRRQESAGHAGRLRDHLRLRFGDIVFQDVDDIPPGEVFENVLDRALKACQVAVIVIGRNWVAWYRCRRRPPYR